MKPSPVLARSHWKHIRNEEFDLAVLPWGATEAHNYHLPYGTDNYQAKHVAENAAAIAWEKGARVTVLPGIDYGVNTGQLDINLCMNMNPSTQMAILKDICDVLVRHNVEKLVILNGHGANNFVPHIRELAILFPGLFVCVVNWFKSAPLKDIFDEPGDHADEMETSVMMHIVPEMVLPLKEAGSGKAKVPRFAARKEGWVWFPRAWTQVTRDTGIGNPRKASAEKGARYLETITGKIADFMVELENTAAEDIYQ